MKKEFIVDLKIIYSWIESSNTWMGKDGKFGFVGKLYVLAEYSGELYLLEKELK